MYHGFGLKRFKVKDLLYCAICREKLEENKFAINFYCQHGRMYISFYVCKDCTSSDKITELQKPMDLHCAMTELLILQIDKQSITNGELQKEFTLKIKGP